MPSSSFSLALLALLGPGAVALLLAIVTPLRNRISAIVLSIAAALSALDAAIDSFEGIGEQELKNSEAPSTSG